MEGKKKIEFKLPSFSEIEKAKDYHIKNVESYREYDTKFVLEAEDSLGIVHRILVFRGERPFQFSIEICATSRWSPHTRISLHGAKTVLDRRDARIFARIVLPKILDKIEKEGYYDRTTGEQCHYGSIRFVYERLRELTHEDI